jgi:hypothetical protein
LLGGLVCWWGLVMSSQTWLETPYCKVDIEIEGGVPYIHATVSKWNKTVLRNGHDIITAICEELAEYGYKRVYTYNRNQDKKWEKFLSLYGFEHIATLDCGLKLFVKEFYHA